ncbi:MAG: hypothetical protein Ct9H300mP5_2740 [Candidatus Pelagibacterales bacterium]|nr:MAG: hypothetical protein Ct9H300mP5_2740 [Pelagibacterales bacterium]
MEIIFRDGLKRECMKRKKNLLLHHRNERKLLPSRKTCWSDQGILKGMYLFKDFKGKGKAKVQMLGSGNPY